MARRDSQPPNPHTDGKDRGLGHDEPGEFAGNHHNDVGRLVRVHYRPMRSIAVPTPVPMKKEAMNHTARNVISRSSQQTEKRPERARAHEEPDDEDDGAAGHGLNVQAMQITAMKAKTMPNDARTISAHGMTLSANQSKARHARVIAVAKPQ